MISLEKNKNDTEISPAEDIYTSICATYPFLTKEEESTFHEKISKINTKDPVEQVKLVIEALDNPHAEFYKKSDRSNETLKARLPTAEVIENILVMKIPSLSRNKNELTDLFDKYADSSDGLIIDLRNCRGGHEITAIELQKKLVPKGTYEFGTDIVMAPEGKLTPMKCTFTSENTQPYDKPIVVLTSGTTCSSAERFLVSLRESMNITIIGTDTRGGSANPETKNIDIDGETYVVTIPTWKFIPKGESKPIEETKIKPDVYYKEEGIVSYALKYIEKLKMAAEEGERTKVTSNVLKIAEQIDPENKLSRLDLVEEICRYIRVMTPSQEILEEGWKNSLIPKRDKWDTSADELLSEGNLIPGHSMIRNIDGCTQIAYITRALLLTKGIPSLMVDTIERKWLENNPKWKNDKSVTVSGHYFVDVYIPEEKKWYTVNPGNREERIHEHGDYSIFGGEFVKMMEGRDTVDMGFNNIEEYLNKLQNYLNN